MASLVLTKSTLALISGSLCWLYQDEIKSCVNGIASKIINYFKQELIIDPSSHKVRFAIRQFIDDGKVYNNLKVFDGGDVPNYEPSNDVFFINSEYGYFWITLKGDDIRITTYCGDIKNVQKFCDKIYKKYNCPENMIMLVTSEKDSWSFPIYREPRNVKNLKITNDMKKVMDDVKDFMNSEDKYNKQSIPYKMGYFLQGKAGVGKSTLIELIAIEYNMTIHLTNLNAESMSDTILINLLCKVPGRSIIVFDEFDSQLETIQKNKMVNISIGGILSAIDGPQRLSKGCIIIFTSNKKLKEYRNSEKLINALIRPGRIDKEFELSEKFINS